MKTVTVLYFAALRDLAGTEAEQLQLPPEVANIEQFVRYLGTRHAPLKGTLTAVRVARNEVFAESDEVVEAGDILALIPPVQGG